MTTKKIILTVILCAACVPFFFWFGMKVRADNTVGDLQAQAALLELRIEQTKAEYQAIAAERAEVQRACNMMDEKTRQMTTLNTMNDSRRDEIKLIDQKIASLTASQPETD